MASRTRAIGFKRHAKQRSMWLGSKLVTPIKIWALDETKIFKETNITASEALLKTIDELFVNAEDRVFVTSNYTAEKGGPTTRIDFKYNVKTGELIVENDGQGFSIHKMEKDDLDEERMDLLGKNSVLVSCMSEMSGTNFQDKENKDRVTGGINGLGIKLVNIHSKKFEVETVDAIRKKKVTVTFRDQMEKVPDDVKPVDYKKKAFTKITYKPDYELLCKIDENKTDPDWYNKERGNDIMKYVEMRAYQTAAFIASIDYRYDGSKRINHKRKVKVYFNDTLIKIDSLDDFMAMFGIKDMATVTLGTGIKHTDKKTLIKFPWTVGIGDSSSCFEHGKQKAEFMSLINGVYASEGGSHINFLYNKLWEHFEPRITRLIGKKSSTKFTESSFKNMIFLFDCRQIPIANFKDQTKSKLTLGAAHLKEIKALYDFPKAFIDKVWKFIKETIELTVLQTKTSKKKGRVKKMKHAEQLGKGSKIMYCEGDSAAKTCDDIINYIGGYKKWGLFIGKGVPPNALKETTEILKGKIRYLKKTSKLENNEIFTRLIQAIGLDFACDYYYGPTDPKNSKEKLDSKRRKKGDADYEKLNYQEMVVAVDQDHDGKGQIFGIIIIFIWRFWPELIKRGFIKRINTPIIRVYCPKNIVKEFYTDKEFINWKRVTFDTGDVTEDVKNIPAEYKAEYYKGLATHTPEEVENMATHFKKHLYTYTYDDLADRYLNIMYGKDADERKKILGNFKLKEYDQDLLKHHKIMISDQLRNDTKAYQLDAGRRQLPHCLDGQKPVQRKLLCYGRKIGNKKAKVYIIASGAAKKMCYAHGDASINGALIKMAQIFTGTNQLPLYLPISNNFGSRNKGTDAKYSGQPRYISTVPNVRLIDALFPPEDDWMLEYEYEDGKQVEPSSYIPIVPLSILETTSNPSVGWKIDVFARDFNTILKLTRNMINGKLKESESKKSETKKSETKKSGSKTSGSKTSGSKTSGSKTPKHSDLSDLKLFKPELKEGMRYAVGFKGSKSGGSETIIGSCKYDKATNTVIVTQLPPREWTHNYICKLLGLDDEENPKISKKGVANKNANKEYIKSILDRSKQDDVEIHIKLTDGAYSEIKKGWGKPDEDLSPLEDYLNLRTLQRPLINMMTSKDGVKEFQSYMEVMKYWYVEREKLYKVRIERNKLLLEYRIIYYKNMQKFIDMDGKKEISIYRKSREVQDGILSDNKFIKINKTNLLTPKYIKLENLKKMIFEENASYEYIYGINFNMTSKEEIKKWQEKIDDAEKKLEELKNTTAKKLWLEDLDKLEKIVDLGQKTKWTYGHKKHKFETGDTSAHKDKSKDEESE